MSGDPLYYYVRDSGSPIAHHWDYVGSRTDHALCGYAYQAPAWEGEDRPRAVCRACQALLPAHEARWWRNRAHDLEEVLASDKLKIERLHARIAELEVHIDNQRQELRRLNVTLTGQQRRRRTSLHTTGTMKSRPVARRSTGAGSPDNSAEAIARRLRDESGPMSAANISTTWRRPAGRVRIYRGGLPGLGKRR